MPTNYPQALDDTNSLPNPTGSTSTQGIHAKIHDNANDAIKALQLKLGTGNSTPSAGGVLLSDGTNTNWINLTKSIVGLGNVDNTSDINKPVSTATQTALNLKADTASLGLAATSNNYNDLSNKPDLSALSGVKTYANMAAFPVTGADNTVYIAKDTGYTYRWNGTGYSQLTDMTAIWGNIGGTLNNQTDLQAALNSKQAILGYTPENQTNKSTDGTFATPSNTTYPSTQAVSTYVASQIATGTVPDATTTSKGKIQLAGDLNGTAGNPLVKNIQRIFNVKDSAYGALGDGTTDDTTAINAAINAANTAGGGIVYFPIGMYSITSPISLTGKSNIWILGNNKKSGFVIPQSALANFNFGYMLSSDSTGVDITVSGMRFYGQYSVYSSPASNKGGLIAPGKRWVVRDNLFEDNNYFGVFLGSGCSDSKIINNNFKGPSRGEDNIGGGGYTNVEIYGNIYEPGLAGNALDHTSGSHLSYHHNTIKGSNPAYIEGLSYVTLHDNEFEGGGGITVQSDIGYNPTSITNSRYVSIKNNRLQGGQIRYTVGTSATKSSTVGGDIDISGNEVNLSQDSGIVITGGSDDVTRWGTRYSVINNRVNNPNVGNTTGFNTGYGTAAPSGINIMSGLDVVVVGNVTVDDRATPQMQYGIQIGQTFSPSTSNQPNRVFLSGNVVNGAVVSKTAVVSTTYTQCTEATREYLNTNGLNYGFGTKTPSYPWHFASNVGIDSGSGTNTLTLRDGSLSKTAGTGFSLSSGLALSGLLQLSGSTYTASANLTAVQDVVFASAATASFTLTLPNATSVSGGIYFIKKVDNSTNFVTVNTTSLQTIDGVGNYVLNTYNQWIVIVSDGFNWEIVGTTPATTTTPSGNAGGDLTGTYPNPSVVQATNTVAGKTLLGATGGAASYNDSRITGAEQISNKSNDATFASPSSTTYPTTQAVVTYVSGLLTGALNFKGSTDASTNPNYPSAKKGDVYVVSVAGKIGGASGVSVDVGDEYFAIADNAGGTQAAVGSNWDVLEHNLVGALLSTNNLSDVSSAVTAFNNIKQSASSSATGVIQLSGDLTGTSTLPALAASGVTAGTYGSANAIPVPVVDAKGRITSISTVALADATTSSKGIIQLTNDLGGTSTAPTTPTALHITGNETAAGTKTFSANPIFSALTVGSIPYVGTGGLVSQDNNNFFWDSTNKRLGIGTSTPYASQHIQGSNTNNNPIGAFAARFAASSTNVRGAGYFHYYDGTYEKFAIGFAGSNGAPSNSQPINISNARFIVDERGFALFGRSGDGTATAVIDVAASTIAGASVRLRSGVTPTTPNDGDEWNDGSYLYGRFGNATLGYVEGKLATTTGINAFTTGNTALYTVPTGKTAIITKAIVRVSAATSVTNGPTASIGGTTTGDVFASTALNALTTTSKAYSFNEVGMFTTVPAGTVINFNISAAATGTSETLVVDLLGYVV